MNSPEPINESDHIRGIAGAKITVIKYGDYECHECRQKNRALLKAAHEFENQVRYVYRHFPLVRIHLRSLRAAEAAEAAAAQGKFWEMHEKLFANPDRLEDHDLQKYAGEIGLDTQRFAGEMREKLYADQIMRKRDVSINHGVTGTPTFYLDGVMFAGSGEQLLDKVASLVRAYTEEEMSSHSAPRIVS